MGMAGAARLRGLAGRDYRSPTLAEAPAADAAVVLDVIERDKDADHGAVGEACAIIKESLLNKYPARRYLALASQNFCHFGAQPAACGSRPAAA